MKRRIVSDRYLVGSHRGPLCNVRPSLWKEVCHCCTAAYLPAFDECCRRCSERRQIVQLQGWGGAVGHLTAEAIVTLLSDRSPVRSAQVRPCAAGTRPTRSGPVTHVGTLKRLSSGPHYSPSEVRYHSVCLAVRAGTALVVRTLPTAGDCGAAVSSSVCVFGTAAERRTIHPDAWSRQCPLTYNWGTADHTAEERCPYTPGRLAAPDRPRRDSLQNVK
jgi:hypothetical protein